MRSQKRSPVEFLSRGLLRLEQRLRGGRDSQTILLLAYMPALGYAVHMTPIHEALHRAGYTVVVATCGLNADLLRHSPHVDRVLETPDPMQDLSGAVSSLRGKLRQHNLRPRCVLTGPQDQRTRVGLLAALACGGWRGGFAVHPWLYTAPLAYDRNLSRVDNNLRLAALLGCPTEGCAPRVFFSAAQAKVAAHLLSPIGPAPTMAVIAGNSGGLPTAWHNDRWAQVIRYAHTELGYHPVYLGTARDEPVIDRIRALAEVPGTSLAGRTSVGELAAVLAQSDLAVSLMTGTLHVARAVGTPTVALGLAWEPALEWMSPPQAHVHLLRGADAARTSGYRVDDLSASQVIAGLDTMAELYPASAEGRAARVRNCIYQS